MTHTAERSVSYMITHGGEAGGVFCSVRYYTRKEAYFCCIYLDIKSKKRVDQSKRPTLPNICCIHYLDVGPNLPNAVSKSPALASWFKRPMKRAIVYMGSTVDISNY